MTHAATCPNDIEIIYFVLESCMCCHKIGISAGRTAAADVRTSEHTLGHAGRALARGEAASCAGGY